MQSTLCRDNFTRRGRSVADTWHGENDPAPKPIGITGWLRVVLRAVPLVALVFGGLGLLLLTRLIERPAFGMRRPVTPYITQTVCRLSLIILGVSYRRTGEPMQRAGAVVANHASWLDIFALNAAKRVYFVAKSEVAGWPVIGWLARATGTVFIVRDKRAVADQIRVFQERLAAGHQLLFFPEGTSTDGMQVLPFKPTLFGAFFDEALKDNLRMQAVGVIYRAPAGEDPRFYGWWGDMDFAPHLIATLAARRQGDVHLVYHPPVNVADFAGRKALAAEMEAQVRAGLAQHRGP